MDKNKPATNTLSPHWSDGLLRYFFRHAASGLLPGKWFLPSVPSIDERHACTGKLTLEIVSHCWQYSHFLVYQLSSLVNFPPTKLDVTVTVFYAEEDADTRAILDFFGSKEIEGVTWCWKALPKESLFRRTIGRNQAALATQANWIWFTDCDLIFHRGCLDALADELQGRRDALLYPRQEKITSLLANSDQMLVSSAVVPQVLDIDTSRFTIKEKTRATGPLQITHGDIARDCGYCDSIKAYQKPAAHWCKAYEDRIFRWLLRTQGVAINLPGVCRIRHITKGRYNKGSLWSKVRGNVRYIKSWLSEQGRAKK